MAKVAVYTTFCTRADDVEAIIVVVMMQEAAAAYESLLLSSQKLVEVLNLTTLEQKFDW